MTDIPEKRCAFAEKCGSQYLFVVVPKSKPPPTPTPSPKEEIPFLMFFDDAPAPTLPPEPPLPTPPSSPAELTGDRYAPASEWSQGSRVIPLQLTGNGQLQRPTSFAQTEFESLADAYRKCGPFNATIEFPALFGYLLLDKAYFLVADTVTPGAPLPRSAKIWRVLATRWIPISLPGVAPVKMTPSDRERLREFEDYSHKSGYYYSDHVNLLLPFPFSPGGEMSGGRSAPLPQFNCDWTEHLRKHFQIDSIRSACSVLVRGFVCDRSSTLRDGSHLHLLLLGRQNKANPGPRYLGRGLNEANGAGNDHYYEYVMWRDRGADVTYTRHSILRGTIPVNWSTQMSMSLSEPAMIFSANKAEVIRGSDSYFLNAFTSLQNLMYLDSNGNTATNPKVHCVSMLRVHQHTGEGQLARYYHDAVRAVDAAIKATFPRGQLDLVHLDWLNLVKDYGIDVATSSYWEATIPFLCQSSSTDDALMSVGVVRRDGSVERLISQSRFIRVNCADSLDRTNLGCFFVCLQVSAAMLAILHVKPDMFTDNRVLPQLAPSDDIEGEVPYAAAFAPVSGAKNTIPLPFFSTWNEVRDRNKVPPAVIRSLAEMFAHNGDCVAMLYTSSAAMHGNILRALCDMRLASHNAVIATQRKFENAFEDRKKFRSIELLLGKHLDVHFPSISTIFLTRPVPHTLWGCALVLVGIPPGSTAAAIEEGLRAGWDKHVLPWLVSSGDNAPIESSALCFNMSFQGGDVTLEHSNYNATVGKLTVEVVPAGGSGATGMNPEGAASGNSGPSENLAVVEFDPNLCSVINAPSLLRQKGRVTVKDRNCILAPYAYPVQTEADDARSGGGVKASLKRGLKNFVRNLN